MLNVQNLYGTLCLCADSFTGRSCLTFVINFWKLRCVCKENGRAVLSKSINLLPRTDDLINNTNNTRRHFDEVYVGYMRSWPRPATSKVCAAIYTVEDNNVFVLLSLSMGRKPASSDMGIRTNEGNGSAAFAHHSERRNHIIVFWRDFTQLICSPLGLHFLFYA